MTDTEDQILHELRKISRLMAVASLKELTQRERIELLGTSGFAPREIADLLGTTPNTVSVALSKMKRRSRTNPSGPKAGGRSNGER